MPALDQWEKRLLPYFGRPLHMIGEIPISRPEMDDMATGVRGCIQRQGLPRATEILDSQYPHAYLVFLTAFGAYNTARDYWGALGEEIGAAREHLFNHRWHQRYLEKIKKLGLRYFAEDDSSTPYVTTIRYHGGIPVYSLADYFRHFVMPAVDRPELTEVSARQALDVLIRTAYNVDSPVINFLENSGALGETFFEACCKLARNYRQRGEILPAPSLDLPERVVRAFESFVQEELLPAVGDLKLRLRKPILLFTTETTTPAHLYVRLPEQEIPLRFAEGRLEWRINLTGVQQNLQRPCQTKMRRQHMIIEEDYLPVDAAPQSVHVALVFLSNDQIEILLKRWPIPLMTSIDSDQVLAFRVDGTALRSGEPLPAEEVLLVYPVDIELKIEGVSGPSHRLGNLYDAWTGWQANGWDLSQAWAVQMLRDGHPVGMPLPVAGKLPMPELLGEPFSHNADPGGTQLYIGRLPTLRIPLRPDIALNRELARWRIELRSSWNAQPDIQESCPLVRIQEAVTVQDGWAHIPLAHLIGSTPIGTYSLCLSSPYEDDIEFRFRVWPKVTVMGLKRAIFPTVDGTEVQALTLILPDEASCEAQTGAEGLEISHKVYGWEVIVAPETIRADLDLAWERSGVDAIRVPVFIPIPRLRWALTLDQGQLQWTLRLIQRTFEQVLQSETGAVHITMSGLDTAYRIGLEVVDVETERIRQYESFQKTPFSPDWFRLSISKLRDTLRNAGSLARLDLYYQATQSDEAIHIPLVLLSRKVEVSNIELRPIGELKWLLAWKEAYPIKSRRVLIQPAWQPWQEAWEFRISDKNSGSLLILDVGLPSARYDFHFYTAPPDDPALKSIPIDADKISIDLCLPDERLAELSELSAQALTENAYEAAFRATLEAACIYEDLGQFHLRDEKLSELAKPFIHINNLRLLLGFFRWLDRRQIENPTSNFFYRYMFKPELVKQILKRNNKHSPELREYLTYVPKVKDIYAESAHMIIRVCDNPAVLNTCLKRLLLQRDDKVITLIIEMVSKARLSNQDAIDLIGTNYIWALEQLASVPSTQTADTLIANLITIDFSARISILPLMISCSEEFPSYIYNLFLHALPFLSNEIICDYIKWFLDEPCIEDVQTLLNQIQQKKLVNAEIVQKLKTILSPAVKSLIKKDQKGIYRILMELFQIQVIDEDVLKEFLYINPKQAIKAINDAPSSEVHQILLLYLQDKFPGAAGVVVKGGRVRTIAGIARVQSIWTVDGKELPAANLRDPDLLIRLETEEGPSTEVIVLDTSKNIFYFPGKESVWKCGNCEFYHPNSRAINQHHSGKHPHLKQMLSSVPSTVHVDLNKIDLL